MRSLPRVALLLALAAGAGLGVDGADIVAGATDATAPTAAPTATLATTTARRVVTLAPHLAELACAIGACDRLAGVAAHTDHPPQAAALPQVGDAWNLNAERLLALEPDLVLAWRGGNSEATVMRLRALGLQVEWIEIRGLDGVAEAMLQLGDRLGAAAGAHAAAAAYRERLAALRAQHAPDGSPLRVFYQIELAPMYTISARSPISEAISLCGGANLFADLPQIAAPVGVESVIARAPQVIVFARQDDGAAIRAFWRRWPQVPAVAQGRIVSIDADLLARQSPRVLDGVEQLCEALAAPPGATLPEADLPPTPSAPAPR